MFRNTPGISSGVVRQRFGYSRTAINGPPFLRERGKYAKNHFARLESKYYFYDATI